MMNMKSWLTNLFILMSVFNHNLIKIMCKTGANDLNNLKLCSTFIAGIMILFCFLWLLIKIKKTFYNCKRQDKNKINHIYICVCV